MVSRLLAVLDWDDVGLQPHDKGCPPLGHHHLNNSLKFSGFSRGETHLTKYVRHSALGGHPPSFASEIAYILHARIPLILRPGRAIFMEY